MELRPADGKDTDIVDYFCCLLSTVENGRKLIDDTGGNLMINNGKQVHKSLLCATSINEAQQIDIIYSPSFHSVDKPGLTGPQNRTMRRN